VDTGSTPAEKFQKLEIINYELYKRLEWWTEYKNILLLNVFQYDEQRFDPSAPGFHAFVGQRAAGWVA
jgi:hypothetical protein